MLQRASGKKNHRLGSPWTRRWFFRANSRHRGEGAACWGLMYEWGSSGQRRHVWPRRWRAVRTSSAEERWSQGHTTWRRLAQWWSSVASRMRFRTYVWRWGFLQVFWTHLQVISKKLQACFFSGDGVKELKHSRNTEALKTFTRCCLSENVCGLLNDTEQWIPCR